MIKQIHASEFKEMPWRNGKGITTELYRIPAEDPAQFNFRLSVARISQDAPFSIFPEIDRHMLILEGKGVMLIQDGKHLKLTDDGQYYSFPGEAKIESRLLEGQVLDFNVMTKRNWGESSVHLAENEKIRSTAHFTFIYQHGPKPSLYILEPNDEMHINQPSIIIELKLNNA